MPKPSTTKIKNFRRKLLDLTEQELDIRVEMKRLYDQFVLDVGESDLAQRHVRLAYFQIQKFRIRERMKELFEFHPFFGLQNVDEAFEEDGESDDEMI